MKPLQSSLFGWGQPLVHEDLGIGRYRGLSVVETSHGSYEAVDLEYADGDYLHLPMDRLHLVHPYVGSDNDSPALFQFAQFSLGATKTEDAPIS